MRYKFTFFHDYYNERGEHWTISRFHQKRDGYNLSSVEGAEYLMVFDVYKPGIGFNYELINEQGKK